MGLDMYLEKRTSVKKWSFRDEKEHYEIIIWKGGEINHHIKPERIVHVSEEICTWRKANAIHLWFVNNVQGGDDDCKEYYVSYDQLKTLLKTVDSILQNRELAPELLPTESGFFYGSQEYDEYYFDNLIYTQKILSQELQSDDDDSYYYYSSSW